MSSTAAGTRKISFQTMEMELSLTETEYAYLKFICEATLRDSDAVLREQIRAIQVVGLPTFDQWRQQQPVSTTIVHPTVALPPVIAEVTAIDNGVIDNSTVSSIATIEQPRSQPRERRRKAKTEPLNNGSLLTPSPVNDTISGNGAATKTKSRRKSGGESTTGDSNQRANGSEAKPEGDLLKGLTVPVTPSETSTDNDAASRETKPKRSPRGKRGAQVDATAPDKSGVDHSSTPLPAKAKNISSERKPRSQEQAGKHKPPREDKPVQSPQSKRGTRNTASTPTAQSNGSEVKMAAPASPTDTAVKKSRRSSSNTPGKTGGRTAAKKDDAKATPAKTSRRGGRKKTSDASDS